MPADNDIKRKLGIAVATQYTDLSIQFASAVILARLITSEEIGICAVASFMMPLVHVFRDFGVSKYLIQEPELIPRTNRSGLEAATMLAWAVALTLISLCHVMSATLPSSLVTVCTVIVPLLFMAFASALSYPLVDAAIGGLIAVAGLLVGVLWFRHPIREHSLQTPVWLSAHNFSRS